MKEQSARREPKRKREVVAWKFMLCPFHDDHKPSLAYNEKDFICLACGRKGTVDDLRRVTNLPEQEERK